MVASQHFRTEANTATLWHIGRPLFMHFEVYLLHNLEMFCFSSRHVMFEKGAQGIEGSEVGK
jgi:hypothetical protein